MGGAERLIVDAAVELASHGHKIHVFTAHHDRARCFEETLAGSWMYAHICGAFFVALCMLFMWPSFDVILADQVSVVIPLLKLKKLKVVFYCHFPDMLLAQHTTVLRRIYRKPIDFLEEMTTGMADLILVNSKFTASTFANSFKHLVARGIKPSVLYPAVNVDQFDEPRDSKLNFLSINRFERKKNIDLAISAFAMLHTREGNVLKGHNVADATLTVAGKSIYFLLVKSGFDERLRENVEYLEELKSLAERKGVSDQVKFMTSCSTAERNALLSQCLCVLYTPKDEHFGIVPLEAMAAHKPVIACNSGGPVETIKNGVTGFLCDPSPRDFSLAMEKFIRDPQMAARMGAEARQHVTESFATKIFGQRLNQILVDVAKGKWE
ncbi:Hexosyltransferase [Sarracenia purpurea var. burkii]